MSPRSGQSACRQPNLTKNTCILQGPKKHNSWHWLTSWCRLWAPTGPPRPDPTATRAATCCILYVFLRVFREFPNLVEVKICISPRRDAHFGRPPCGARCQNEQCIMGFAVFQRVAPNAKNTCFRKRASRRGERPILAPPGRQKVANHHGALAFHVVRQEAAKWPPEGRSRADERMQRFFKNRIGPWSSEGVNSERKFTWFPAFSRK